MFSFSSISQGTEDQRKYLLDSAGMAELIPTTAEGINGLKAHYHSDYVYYDLYLDGFHPLYEKGYSLRFRKRIMNDTIITYGFQLKSEMQKAGDVRIEVEETELDFYLVKDGQLWIPLTEVLDNLFRTYETRWIPADEEVFKHNLTLIRLWLEQKAEAPIAPFQKLRHIDSAFFSKQMIKTFVPMIIGKSFRKRGHIYIDPNQTEDSLKTIPVNRIKQDERSQLFTEHPDYNWVMEVSIDESTFELVRMNEVVPKFTIREFEVENKYMDEEVGRTLMESFEKGLVDQLNVEIELASKYKQTMQQILLLIGK